MADFSKFRTAVSGFNRTDVVNYIESASMEHQKALRKLTDERDKLAAENAQLQTQLTGLQARLIQVQADKDALTEQVNTLAQEGSDLAEQLKAAEQKRDEYLDLAQRVQAEFDNFRRRNNAARAESYDDGVREAVKTLLPTLDNLERALGAAESALRSLASISSQSSLLSLRNSLALSRPCAMRISP